MKADRTSGIPAHARKRLANQPWPGDAELLAVGVAEAQDPFRRTWAVCSIIDRLDDHLAADCRAGALRPICAEIVGALTVRDSIDRLAGPVYRRLRCHPNQEWVPTILSDIDTASLLTQHAIAVVTTGSVRDADLRYDDPQGAMALRCWETALAADPSVSPTVSPIGRWMVAGDPLPQPDRDRLVARCASLLTEGGEAATAAATLLARISG